MLTDVPKIDIWLAMILTRLIEAGAMSLAYLQNSPESMIEDGKAAPFAVVVLEQLKARLGPSKTKELLTASGLDLGSLVPPSLENSEEEIGKMMERLAL